MPATTQPRSPRGPHLARWRTAAAWWALQTVLFHALIAQVCVKPGAPLAERLGALAEPDLLGTTLALSLMIAACQAVLLLPAETEARRATHASLWWGRITCGLAVGTLAGAASFGAVWGLDISTSVPVHAWEWWGVGAATFALLTALATIAWLATTSPDGVPAWLRALVAGAFGALGAAALAASACALARWLRDEDGDIEEQPVPAIVLATAFGSWALWTPLLIAFLRRPNAPTRLARLARGLLAGSIVHAAAVLPLEVMVRRKTSCYCSESSFWALSATLGVGLFAVGPAVFLVPFAARRSALRRGLCPACGYDLTTLPPPRVCPECGPDRA